MIRDDTTAKLTRFLEELNHGLDPEMWPEILEEIAELERDNPVLLDRNFMADWMTMFFVQAVHERSHSDRTLDESKIRQFLLHHPRPLVAGARLCLILDHVADPNFVLEEALREQDDKANPVQ